MREYKWMKLDDVLRSIPAMEDQGVSKVARGMESSKQTKEGWVQAYIATGGNPVAMAKRLTGRSDWETWKDRRQQFLSRHLGRVKKDKEPLWKNGQPTRRHLALVAWGYTPDTTKYRQWLKTQPTVSSGEWKRGVKVLKDNPSIGYNSWAWTTQDWRSLFLHSDGSISYDKKCGASGTKLPSGKPRLCLPLYVIEKLIKNKSGRDILTTQIKKKQRAEKGQRIQWHPRIKELHRELEAMTPQDRPSLRKNPVRVLVDETKEYRDRYEWLDSGIIGVFDEPIQLFRVIDENEYRIINETGKVTGGNWADPSESEYGASWGEDLDEVIEFGIGWKERGRLEGQLYILTANGYGKKFAHLDGFSDDIPEVIEWNGRCGTGLGCSLKFDLNEVEIYLLFN